MTRRRPYVSAIRARIGIVTMLLNRVAVMIQDASPTETSSCPGSWGSTGTTRLTSSAGAAAHSARVQTVAQVFGNLAGTDGGIRSSSSAVALHCSDCIIGP
jgi:hypothetical protein